MNSTDPEASLTAEGIIELAKTLQRPLPQVLIATAPYIAEARRVLTAGLEEAPLSSLVSGNLCGIQVREREWANDDMWLTDKATADRADKYAELIGGKAARAYLRIVAEILAEKEED